VENWIGEIEHPFEFSFPTSTRHGARSATAEDGRRGGFVDRDAEASEGAAGDGAQTHSPRALLRSQLQRVAICVLRGSGQGAARAGLPQVSPSLAPYSPHSHATVRQRRHPITRTLPCARCRLHSS
jgi:hypothetical protein